MYLLADDVVTVECSPAQAFAYAANLEHLADWFPGVLRVVADDDLSPTVIGKQYSETVSVPLRGKRAVVLRVMDATAPRRLVTHGDLRPLLPRMEMDFVDAGHGTCEVRWRMLSRNESRLAGLTILPIAGWVMARRAKTGLRNLKSSLDGGRRETAAPH